MTHLGGGLVPHILWLVFLLALIEVVCVIIILVTRLCLASRLFKLLPDSPAIIGRMAVRVHVQFSCQLFRMRH